MFSLYAISLHLSAYRDFSQVWTSWYLLRPNIGAGLAFVFYLVLRGGVLSVGSSLSNLNLVGSPAISARVGFFTEHAIKKLHELADTIFGKGRRRMTKRVLM